MATLSTGPSLILSAADAAFLALLLPLLRSEQRRNAWSLSASQRSLLEQLEQLGRAHRSASVPIGLIGPAVEARSRTLRFMTTAQAAQRLQVQPRWVVRLCQRNALAGRMVAGKWQVDAVSVDDYIERRTA